MASYLTPRTLRKAGPSRLPGSALWAAILIDLAVLVLNDVMIARTLGAAAGYPGAVSEVILLGVAVRPTALGIAIGLVILLSLALGGIALWILVGVEPGGASTWHMLEWGLGFALCAVPILAMWFKSTGMALGLGAGLGGFVASETIVTSALLSFPVGLFSHQAALRILQPATQ